MSEQYEQTNERMSKMAQFSSRLFLHHFDQLCGGFVVSRNRHLQLFYHIRKCVKSWIVTLTQRVGLSAAYLPFPLPPSPILIPRYLRRPFSSQDDPPLSE